MNLALTDNITFRDDFGQEMAAITVAHRGKSYTFPLGKNHGAKRTRGAVTLQGCMLGFPFWLRFDLNPDGSTTLRKTSAGLDGNYYLHFADGEMPTEDATPEQTAAIAKWMYDESSRPYGMGISPGGPVKIWAFRGLSLSDVEEIGNNGKRGLYA